MARLLQRLGGSVGGVVWVRLSAPFLRHANRRICMGAASPAMLAPGRSEDHRPSGAAGPAPREHSASVDESRVLGGLRQGVEDVRGGREEGLFPLSPHCRGGLGGTGSAACHVRSDDSPPCARRRELYCPCESS